MELNADEPIALSGTHNAGPRDDSSPGILVSEFNPSVHDHFKFVDQVGNLCGIGSEIEHGDEVARFSDSITFLREWRDFKYSPRVVKFARQRGTEERDASGTVTLSQFSSAAVPKETRDAGKTGGEISIKDFVMHVGGLVWAMDWCPKFENDSEPMINCEFVAVAAHPPESSYNKLGAPLIGRGAIQIWCLLSESGRTGYEPSKQSRRSRLRPQKEGTEPRGRGRPKKRPIDSEPKVPRPRGRPRKKANNDSAENIDKENHFVQPLAIEYPTMSHATDYSDLTSVNAGMQGVNDDGGSSLKDSSSIGNATASKCRGEKVSIVQENKVDNCGPIRRCGHNEDSLVARVKTVTCSFSSASTMNVAICDNLGASECCLPKDAALPRMMICLAHNGKVAWDVKWQPVKARWRFAMGYLAVLLGNGALEVWEVPLPHTVKHVFPEQHELIDPRFIKLRPVFRCSTLKCGDKQSIPLTLEWSAAYPYDTILSGCHDGTVALWKFKVTDTSEETRPMLSFSADTGPIRTLAWSPFQSDVEGASVIITAGHKGFRFWDIRDPFRPLWDYGISGVTCSLDWMADPRCIVGCLDDGKIWLLNLEKAAEDIPITGKPLPITSKHGFHSSDCSSFSIWSIHASRSTGMVAYCDEEGKTFCFQPTTRSARDPSRYRMNHNLCGYLMEEESTIVVITPSPNSTFRERTPSLKRGPGKDEQKLISGPPQACTDEQSLAICHANEPSGNRRAPKSKQSNEQKTDHQPGKVVSFPPKSVAMHRVRWNENRGSENLLCHGGAAGLVRCQEIDFSVFR